MPWKQPSLMRQDRAWRVRLSMMPIKHSSSSGAKTEECTTLHITYTASVGGRGKKIPLSESRRYFWQPGRAQKLARKRNAGERRMQCRTGNMAGTMVIYLKANPKIQKMCRLFSSSLHLALMSGFAAVWSSASLTHTHTHTGCGRPMLRTL